MKIVQIDGIRGLVTALFVVACLFAGFVIAPGYVAMNLWNTYLVNLYSFPVLDLLQGVLLWGIVAVSYSIIFKNNFALSFKTTSRLTEDEISSLIDTAKMHKSMNFMNKKFNKHIERLDIAKKDILKAEKESSYVSTPSTLSKTEISEKVEESDTVSK